MEGGGVMEGWGATAHSPGLVIACVRSCTLAVVRRRLSRVWLSSFMCIRFGSWACVVVRGRSFPLVGMCPRPWAFVFVRGRSFPFMGGWLCLCMCVSVLWCAVGRLVDPCGRSWCSHVVAGGVSFVVVGHVTWALLLMLEKEVGVWGYGTHLHAQ